MRHLRGRHAGEEELAQTIADIEGHPDNGIPALLGRDATLAKDVDGKEYGKAIIAAANAGGGWTEYRMTNPATKKVEPKKTYSVKVGDYTLGCGAYILAGNDK